MKKAAVRRLKDYMLITVSCFFYAVGVSLFFDPNKLAPGGVTGISIIINHLTGISTGTMILAINIPIMIFAIYKFGLKLFISTIYALAVSSFMINLLAPFGALTHDRLLATVTGAVILGGSIGVIFKVGATTGGADIIVKLLRLKFRHLKTGAMFIFFDGFVVAASGVLLKDIDSALYAGIAVFLQALVLDMVLYATDGARLIYVISDMEVKISDRFIKEMDVGVTFLKGSGAFTNKDKKVMMCAMRKQQLPKAREIVLQEDVNAFLIVTNAHQIFGEGFRRHDSVDL